MTQLPLIFFLKNDNLKKKTVKRPRDSLFQKIDVIYLVQTVDKKQKNDYKRTYNQQENI